MYIHKLKFKDKSECEEIFNTREMYSELIDSKINDSIMTIVTVGTITKEATYDEEGNELTPETVIEGWHVDVLAKEIIEELREYCLAKAPNHPIHGYGWGYSIDDYGNVVAPILVCKEGELQL